MVDYFLSACLRYCFDMIDTCARISKDYTENMVDFIYNNQKKFEIISDRNNVYYFNGYLRGYEAAINDYKGLYTKETVEPANLFL